MGNAQNNIYILYICIVYVYIDLYVDIEGNFPIYDKNVDLGRNILQFTTLACAIVPRGRPYRKTKRQTTRRLGEKKLHTSRPIAKKAENSSLSSSSSSSSDSSHSSSASSAHNRSAEGNERVRPRSVTGSLCHANVLRNLFAGQRESVCRWGVEDGDGRGGWKACGQYPYVGYRCTLTGTFMVARFWYVVYRRSASSYAKMTTNSSIHSHLDENVQQRTHFRGKRALS